MGCSIGTAKQPLQVSHLGIIDYQEAWDLQAQLALARREDRIPDTLLLLEHPHTYTLGRRGHEENLLLDPQQLAERGIALYHVDRGGDITYHGPGQLVGYPIIKLPPELPKRTLYIRQLEQALLLAVADLGLAAELKTGLSGIWVGNDKVCAIGVKIDAAGVTSHGFALNINPDLAYFKHIIPCGLVGKGVTSIARLNGTDVSWQRVEHVVIDRLGEAFSLAPRTAHAEPAGRRAGSPRASVPRVAPQRDIGVSLTRDSA